MKDSGDLPTSVSDHLPAVSTSVEGAAQREAHTPGPWTIDVTEGDELSPPLYTVYDDYGDLVCITGDLERANLVRSAPDLLAALYRTAARLEGIRAWAQHDSINFPVLANDCRDEAKEVRELIAKATGALS